jgi:hypothetical protein
VMGEEAGHDAATRTPSHPSLSLSPGTLWRRSVASDPDAGAQTP